MVYARLIIGIAAFVMVCFMVEPVVEVLDNAAVAITNALVFNPTIK